MPALVRRCVLHHGRLGPWTLKEPPFRRPFWKRPQGGGRCARHGGHCSVPAGEVDIFVGGFPCTPSLHCKKWWNRCMQREACVPLAVFVRYSFCNPKRFKRNCFTEPAAVPFFEMSAFFALCWSVMVECIIDETVERFEDTGCFGPLPWVDRSIQI